MTDEQKIKVYTGMPREDVTILPMLGGHFSRTDSTGMLFKDFFDQLDFSFLKTVEHAGHADFFLIPHDYFALKRNDCLKECIEEFVQLSKQHQKPIVAVAHGDSDEDITIPHAYVFRTSQYAHKKKEHEIIMPPYSEDLLHGGRPLWREKREKPTISFCGWAAFDNVLSYSKYILKLAVRYAVYVLGGTHVLEKRKGMYFRRKLLRILRKSPLVHTSFVVRKTYSGHEKTIELSRERARNEFIANITHSDFVLAPKGDGNYSMRFYEALSLARFPVLPDTDITLPFEKEIKYKDIAVLVDLTHLDKTPQMVADFYHELSNEEFQKRQETARAVFEEYLRTDSFFRKKLLQLRNERAYF